MTNLSRWTLDPGVAPHVEGKQPANGFLAPGTESGPAEVGVEESFPEILIPLESGPVKAVEIHGDAGEQQRIVSREDSGATKVQEHKTAVRVANEIMPVGIVRRDAGVMEPDHQIGDFLENGSLDGFDRCAFHIVTDQNDLPASAAHFRDVADRERCALALQAAQGTVFLDPGTPDQRWSALVGVALDHMAVSGQKNLAVHPPCVSGLQQRPLAGREDATDGRGVLVEPQTQCDMS